MPKGVQVRVLLGVLKIMNEWRVKSCLNDEDADNIFLKWIKKNRPDIIAGEENEFGLNDGDIMFDPLKIAQDIRNRFEVVK